LLTLLKLGRAVRAIDDWIYDGVPFGNNKMEGQSLSYIPLV
jgi:hypothetical protein